MKQMTKWGREHTLSIPGGMGVWRNYAAFRQAALCPAAMGIDGSADGTVHEFAQFRAAPSKRTVCTVPHRGLPTIGDRTGPRREDAAWPGSR